jgi:peptide/nickel transport system substrate-binding protein
MEPGTYSDLGNNQTESICGEYLNRGAQSKQLLPELALSWKPNATATVWTYKLRPNVTFQTGQPMTADDVVATWKRLASPNSAALSAIGSYLDPSGVVKIDDMTVAFHLTQPIGNFPYLTSSYTPQAIILPPTTGSAPLRRNLRPRARSSSSATPPGSARHSTEPAGPRRAPYRGANPGRR